MYKVLLKIQSFFFSNTLSYIILAFLTSAAHMVRVKALLKWKNIKIRAAFTNCVRVSKMIVDKGDLQLYANSTVIHFGYYQ